MSRISRLFRFAGINKSLTLLTLVLALVGAGYFFAQKAQSASQTGAEIGPLYCVRHGDGDRKSCRASWATVDNNYYQVYGADYRVEGQAYGGIINPTHHEFADMCLTKFHYDYAEDGGSDTTMGQPEPNGWCLPIYENFDAPENCGDRNTSCSTWDVVSAGQRTALLGETHERNEVYWRLGVQDAALRVYSNTLGRRVEITNFGPSSSNVNVGDTFTVDWNTEFALGAHMDVTGPSNPQGSFNVPTDMSGDSYTATAPGVITFKLSAHGSGPDEGELTVEREFTVTVGSGAGAPGAFRIWANCWGYPSPQMEVNSDASSGADGYDLRRNDNGSGWVTVLNNVSYAALDAHAQAVTDGHTYDWEVIARNSTGTTSSGVVSLTASSGNCGGGAQPPEPTCRLNAPGGTLVNFGGKHIWDVGSIDEATSGPVPANIPAGNYKVTIYSYDDNHPGDTAQPQETWESRLFDGSGGLVITVPAGPDLADGAKYRIDVISTNFNVPSAVSSVSAVMPSWFGGGNSITPGCIAFEPTSTPPSCNGNCFQFLSQNINGLSNPSTVNLGAGQTYNATVTLRNTGTTTWSCCSPASPPGDINMVGGYKLGSQNPQDVNPLIPARIGVPVTVSPGGTTTFNMSLTAPTTPGSYNFQWSMIDEGVEWFYQNAVSGNDRYTPNVIVNVSNSALPPDVVLDNPLAGATVTGSVFIGGWAIDNITKSETSIASVIAYIDGNAVTGNIVHTANRPDVCAIFPRPDCPSVGFAVDWDSNTVPNGSHLLSVTATDGDGLTATFSRLITVNNAGCMHVNASISAGNWLITQAGVAVVIANNPGSGTAPVLYSLPTGSYTVTPGPVSGYTTPSAQIVNITTVGCPNVIFSYGLPPITDPTNLELSNANCGKILLTWDDNASNEDNYEVWRRDGAGGPSILIKTLPANANTYTDPSSSLVDPVEGHQYYYKVRATSDNPIPGRTSNFTPERGPILVLPCLPVINIDNRVIAVIHAPYGAGNMVPYTPSLTIKDTDILRLQITVNNSGNAPASAITSAINTMTNNLKPAPGTPNVPGCTPIGVWHLCIDKDSDGNWNEAPELGSVTGTPPTLSFNNAWGPKSVGNPNWVITFDAIVASQTDASFEELKDTFCMSYTYVNSPSPDPTSCGTVGPLLIQTGTPRIPTFREVTP